jgi:AcrR family transcriptional regulator
MALSEDLAEQPKRRRRSREEVYGRIIAVARELFAQRGYAATTTRDIARIADVSETLLFRYFTDKATLFDAVIATPYNTLMAKFIAEQQVRGDNSADKVDAMFAAVFDLFEENRDLLIAAYFGRRTGEKKELQALRGMTLFFEQATQSKISDNGGRDAGLDMATGIRLSFGMIASAVLMREWLFADAPYDRESIVKSLEVMVAKALGPLPSAGTAS